MTTRTFARWLDLYGQAWKAGDPLGVLELFTSDAEYFETPFAPPMIGHEVIRQYWTEGAKNAQRDVRFEAHPITFDGTTGFARWSATFQRVPSRVHVELDGVLSAVCVRPAHALQSVPRVVASPRNVSYPALNIWHH